MDPVAAIQGGYQKIAICRLADDFVEIQDAVEGATVRIHWFTWLRIAVLAGFQPVFVPEGATLWRGMIVTPWIRNPLALTLWMMFSMPAMTWAADASRRIVVRAHEEHHVRDAGVGEDVPIEPLEAGNAVRRRRETVARNGVAADAFVHDRSAATIPDDSPREARSSRTETQSSQRS